MFGDRIELADASDVQTRLLATLGRRVCNERRLHRDGGNDMAFAQIIEFRTSNLEATQEVASRWEDATAGKRTARRRILCRDRKEANRYFNVVFFDSYESAVENSNLPEDAALLPGNDELRRRRAHVLRPRHHRGPFLARARHPILANTAADGTSGPDPGGPPSLPASWKRTAAAGPCGRDGWPISWPAVGSRPEPQFLAVVLVEPGEQPGAGTGHHDDARDRAAAAAPHGRERRVAGSARPIARRRRRRPAMPHRPA